MHPHNPRRRIVTMSTAKGDNNTNDVEQPPTASLVEPLLPSEAPEEEPVVVLTSDPGPIAPQQVALDQELILVDESAWEHGETQEATFRNLFFAVLFLLQLGAVVTLSVMAIVSLSKGNYNFPEVDHKDSPSFHVFLRGVLFLTVVILSIMCLCAFLLMVLLGALADMMIQVSLVLSPLSCGLASLGFLLVGQLPVAAILGIFSLLGIWYAVRVWHRIPFASANLAVAMEAIKANKGLLTMAYGMTVLATTWTMIWCFAVAQATVVHQDWVFNCDDVPSGDDLSASDDDQCHVSTRGKWILVGFVFSFFWTSQVIRNVFHTTIAGVVGTFWFAPQECARGGCCCCSSVLYDSWVRSSIYSFGSICLGSLLVAVLQLMRFLVRLARSQRDENGRQVRQNSIMWCLLEFLVDHLEKLMEYINQWAFVYVGLYGYEYWTAGTKVYHLFRARGWSVILNDQLVNRSLGMMQLFIALLSGALAVVIGLVFVGISVSPVGTFCLGWVLGIVLSSIQLQVVTSAVETVVVCFAEAPNALMENHSPDLATRMVQAWRAAYPTEFGV